MNVEELMTQASHVGISPKDYRVLRDRHGQEWQLPAGKWWTFSFNGVQVIPTELARPGEILIMGVRDGESVMLGKVVSVSE